MLSSSNLNGKQPTDHHYVVIINMKMSERFSLESILMSVFHWSIDTWFHLFKQEQLQAYVAWVNSQLKKRPGSRYIQNLPQDMQDGVALLQLIQVVGKKASSWRILAIQVHNAFYHTSPLFVLCNAISTSEDLIWICRLSQVQCIYFGL